jgi:hypothetical protein
MNELSVIGSLKSVFGEKAIFLSEDLFYLKYLFINEV